MWKKNRYKIFLYFLRNFMFKIFFLRLSNKEKIGDCGRFFKFKTYKASLFLYFANGLTIRGVSYQNFEKDRLALSVSKLSHNKLNSKRAFAENLFNAYKLEENLTIGDILKLPKSHEIHNYPAWAVIYPWDKITIKEKLSNYPKAIVRNRSKHGLIFNSNSVNEIIKVAYSFDAALVQANQFYNLMENIINHGLRINNNPPHVVILRKHDEWKWIMGPEGNHRAYLSYFMNHESIFVKVINYVDIKDVSNWFNVKNGLFSVKDAKKIFNQVYDEDIVSRGLI